MILLAEATQTFGWPAAFAIVGGAFAFAWLFRSM